MPRNITLAALWSIGLVAIAPAIAADVTPQRLVNASDEPQNWLMIHHDYDNSRHSSLQEINRDTVKNLELKYTFSIGGRSTGGINRDTGEVVWEVQAAAPTDPKTGTPSKTQAFSGAPLAIKTAAGRELLVQGESTGGSLGTRSWIGGFDIKTGELAWRTFTIPAPGEPGSETWKDNHNAWRIGGASVWQTASYDPATNLLYFGTGDAFPTFDPEYRPGDNLYTASTLAV